MSVVTQFARAPGQGAVPTFQEQLGLARSVALARSSPKRLFTCNRTRGVRS